MKMSLSDQCGHHAVHTWSLTTVITSRRRTSSRSRRIENNKARRRVNPFIDAETGVDGDARNDEGSDDENDDLDRFIVADDIEF